MNGSLSSPAGRARTHCHGALPAALLLAAVHAPIARAQTIQEHFWVPEGPVNAITSSGNTIFLGGMFTTIGPPSGAGVPLGVASGEPAGPFPRVYGVVAAVASDGAGGWYLAGGFERIGAEARNGLAHVLADGSVAAWDPELTGDDGVFTVVFDGSTVYVGGFFSSVGGQARANIAALDPVTGAATAWNPGASSAVRAIAISGSTFYIGGQFTSAGGQPRNRLAALDAVTGAATGWNPNANSNVYALVVDGSTVYAGGAFTTIGGQSRPRIAAIDAGSGSPTTWNPVSNNRVHTLAVSGSEVYAGGLFTNIGGQARGHIAQIDAGTGSATAWNPDANGNVLSIAVDGSTVYAGGEFTTAGGQTRNRIVALDATTGDATAWDPRFNGAVWALAVGGSKIYAGGQFTSVKDWVVRNRLAALDATTGEATAWDPNVEGPVPIVYALESAGSTVYVGGRFTTVGGLARTNVAAVYAGTGAVSSWDASTDGTNGSQVRALAVSGSTIYAGGGFSAIGGQTRANLGALDAVTGAATPWNPGVVSTGGAGGFLYALAVNGGTVYAGGDFGFVGGLPRSNIAAVDAATGSVTVWNPQASGPVHALAVDGTTVYAGGDFQQSIGGAPRRFLAALDPATGLATAWNPDPDGPVFSFAVDGTTIYAGGGFTTIGGVTRLNIAALDATTGVPEEWIAGQRTWSQALALGPSAVYTGGLEWSYFLAITPHSTTSVHGGPALSSLALAQNQPNPAGRSTLIRFTLPAPAPITLAVFDLKGRRVASLIDGGVWPAGAHSVPFRTTGLANGVYLYRLESMGRTIARKMLVLESD